MLQLDFKDAVSDHSASLGPAQTFKFSRGVVCDESRGHVLATYRSDQWEIEGSLFSGFQCSRPSRIYFEDSTGRRSYGCGPFAGIVVTRGALHVGAPETVANKIAKTAKALGIVRFDLKYSAGTLPHDKLMRCIELYGTKVMPLVPASSLRAARCMSATSSSPIIRIARSCGIATPSVPIGPS